MGTSRATILILGFILVATGGACGDAETVCGDEFEQLAADDVSAQDVEAWYANSGCVELQSGGGSVDQAAYVKQDDSYWGPFGAGTTESDCTLKSTEKKYAVVTTESGDTRQCYYYEKTYECKQACRWYSFAGIRIQKCEVQEVVFSGGGTCPEL